MGERKKVNGRGFDVSVETKAYGSYGFIHEVRYEDTVVGAFRSVSARGEAALLARPPEEVELWVSFGLAKRATEAKAALDTALAAVGEVGLRAKFVGECHRQALAEMGKTDQETWAYARLGAESVEEIDKAKDVLTERMDASVRAEWARDRFDDVRRRDLLTVEADAHKAGDQQEQARVAELTTALEARGLRKDWGLTTNFPREWLQDIARGEEGTATWRSCGPPLRKVDRVMLVDSAMEAAAHQALSEERGEWRTMYLLVPAGAGAQDCGFHVRVAAEAVVAARQAALLPPQPVQVAVCTSEHRDVRHDGKEIVPNVELVDGGPRVARTWTEDLARREAHLIRRHKAKSAQVER